MKKVYPVFTRFTTPVPLFFGLLALLWACQNDRPAKNSATENGNAAMTKDIHSYAAPEQARVTHLDWQATVDFTTKRIKGTATLTFDRAKNADTLILDVNGLDLMRIWSNDNPADSLAYELGPQDPVLGQALRIALLKNTKQVSIEYATAPGARALQWLDPVQTKGGQDPFLFTQSQAILARSWIPLQDSPGVRFTYKAKVTVPNNLMALMSASNPQQLNSNGVYQFEMQQPIPSYLMALTVGNVAFEPLGQQTGVYAEPDVLESAAYEFAEVEQMLKEAEKLYGPYRWERYDLIVLPPSFPFGGMENPRLTFATPTILAGDRSLVSLVAHELAHSWSGNLVTNATWNDFWLNEGFTVYFEQRIMEAVYGLDYAEMLAQLSRKDLLEAIEEYRASGTLPDTRLKADLDGRDPDEGVSAIAYDKGYFFLRFLEEMVGREVWDAFLKTYFEKHAFSTMTTEAFLDYMEKALFEANNISYNATEIADWIYGEGLPESLPEVRATRFEKLDTLLANYTTSTEVDYSAWSTHETLYFLRGLPAQKLTANGMLAHLDQALGLTQSGNSEIFTVWGQIAIENGYEPAYAAIQDFLVRTGRRKFLTPLYTAMKAQGTKGLARARDIYTQARPNYHYVSVNSIDKLLGWPYEAAQ